MEVVLTNEEVREIVKESLERKLGFEITEVIISNEDNTLAVLGDEKKLDLEPEKITIRQPLFATTSPPFIDTTSIYNELQATGMTPDELNGIRKKWEMSKALGKVDDDE